MWPVNLILCPRKAGMAWLPPSSSPRAVLSWELWTLPWASVELSILLSHSVPLSPLSHAPGHAPACRLKSRESWSGTRVVGERDTPREAETDREKTSDGQQTAAWAASHPPGPGAMIS